MQTQTWDQRIAQYKELSATPSEEERPYENKYKALDDLKEILQNIETIEKTLINEQDKRICTAYQGRCNALMGINYFETEEYSNASKALLKAVQLLSNDRQDEVSQSSEVQQLDSSEDELSEEGSITLQIVEKLSKTSIDPSFVCDYADALNFLGMIWANRSSPHIAEMCFKKSELVYTTFKGVEKIDLETIEGEEHHDHPFHQRMLEINTLTAFFLAQMYGHLKKPSLSAEYCAITLKRQLKSGLELNKNDWAVNAMNLAGYFVSECAFSQGYTCLQSAEKLIQGNHDAQLNANMNMAYAKFYQQLLEISRDFIKQRRSSSSLDSDTFTQSDISSEIIQIEPKNKVPSVYFSELGVDTSRSFHYLIDYEEVVQIFKNAKSHFEKALSYYVLDGFVSDHLDLLQRLSTCYRMLIFYEMNPERKFAMHERRIKLFTGILEQLNSGIYLGVMKQISFEMGETYADMFDIAEEERSKSNNSGFFSFRSMHDAGHKSIAMMKQFCNYFTNQDTKQDDVEDENKPAYVKAKLHIARIYYKVNYKSYNEALFNVQKSSEYYEMAYKYASQHMDKLPQFLTEEVQIAKQMMDLIPLKLNELTLLMRINKK